MTTTWETTSVRHGTASGWRLHQRLGERPCDPCYAAKAEYDKRRNLVPFRTVMSRLHARAQSRATTVMRQRHPGEWQALYTQARDELLIERADEIATSKGTQ